MKPVRIQMRLYANRPNDAVVLEWIDSLPVTETGRRQVKEDIVTLLAEALRKRSDRRREHGKRKQKTAERRRKAATARKPEREKPVAKPVSSNGAQRPSVGDPPDQLPDFPAVDSIRF